MSHITWSRRRFLGTTAIFSGAFSIVPNSVFGAGSEPSANSRLTLAGIGVGGVGFDQLDGCEKAGFKIVALCDVDDVYAKKAYDKWPQARRYRDFREMLQAEADKVDAVYIGTPDHTHAICTLAALRKKKHVCCVKPLTRTIHEGRVVLQAKQAAGTATQVTAAPHTSEAGCRTSELISAGAIGPVREVHVWSNRPLWPQGMTRPPGEDPIPKTFDWKLWLGPAPIRPFKDKWPEGHYAVEQIAANRGRSPESRGVYHPWNFRGWWDFGTGALGDMGCHHLNTILYALKLKSPVAVQATATRLFTETAPLAAVVGWDFPERGPDMPPVRVIWYDGGLKPPAPKEMAGKPLPEEGTLYIGDQAKMLGTKILSDSLAKRSDSIPKTLPRRGDTWKEWYEACKGGEPAGCNFDWAVPLTETVLLGNVAIRTEKRLEWDAEVMKFTNNSEANQLLRPVYQNGWEL